MLRHEWPPKATTTWILLASLLLLLYFAVIVSGWSKGDERGAHSPWGPNSFNFMQFFGKFGKIVCWCAPWRARAPTSGKSWIRHWLSYASDTGVITDTEGAKYKDELRPLTIIWLGLYHTECQQDTISVTPTILYTVLHDFILCTLYVTRNGEVIPLRTIWNTVTSFVVVNNCFSITANKLIWKEYEIGKKRILGNRRQRNLDNSLSS